MQRSTVKDGSRHLKDKQLSMYFESRRFVCQTKIHTLEQQDKVAVTDAPECEAEQF